MRKIKIGLIQQANSNDLRINLEKLNRNIAAVSAYGAELVVLQELHNTLYFCQTEDTTNFDLAEPIPGPSTGFYSEIARQFHIVLVTSLFEKRAPGLYHNTAVVFDKDGSIAGKYRKMHIPDDPAYYEKFYFTPGDLGFKPIQTSIGKLGVQVCWDQWYPEGARLMALQGADILIYPTAIGWESSDTDDEKARQLGAWMISQRGHAVANGLPVVAVNRVGQYDIFPSNFMPITGNTSSGEDNSKVVLLSYDDLEKDSPFSDLQYKLTAGDYIQQDKKGAVIHTSLANQNGLEIGDTLKLDTGSGQTVSVPIIGLFKSSGNMEDKQPAETTAVNRMENQIFIDNGSCSDLFKDTGFYKLVVYTDNPENISAL